MKNILNRIKTFIKPAKKKNWEDASLILAANSIINSHLWRETPDFSQPKWIQDKEFSVYSQFGDDGIIQWLIYFLKLPKKFGSFIEFGVGDFFESNTHFLQINNRWRGFVMDGDKNNIKNVRQSPIYWRYELNAKHEFITKENIQTLLKKSMFKKIELLHIDLDGNDYWIIKALDLEIFKPDILILEYNAILGLERKITVPYSENFYRMNAHYSGKYFGASLSALNHEAEAKGYYFIGCNSAGNNAYFLANKYTSIIPQKDLHHGYQLSNFREARNEKGELIYSNHKEESETIKGMPVINIISGKQEIF